jgi:hypothetical protein
VPAQHAELAAFRISKHHPGRLGTLTDAGPGRAERDQPIHLRVPAGPRICAQVDAQPVLDDLALEHPEEAQARVAALVRADDRGVLAFHQARWPSAAAQKRVSEPGSRQSMTRW